MGEGVPETRFRRQEDDRLVSLLFCGFPSVWTGPETTSCAWLVFFSDQLSFSWSYESLLADIFALEDLWTENVICVKVCPRWFAVPRVPCVKKTTTSGWIPIRGYDFEIASVWILLVIFKGRQIDGRCSLLGADWTDPL